MIDGLFFGWPQPPTAATLIAVMQRSYRRVWAIDDSRVIGFVNAISDGVLNAFIPWLESSHTGKAAVSAPNSSTVSSPN